jgi:hypothetical protein
LDRKVYLNEAKFEIERNNISSLRNAVRSLADYSRILLSEMADYYPALTVVKELPIKHRVKLLVLTEPLLEKFEDSFLEIYDFRNAVDHDDKKYLGKERLEKLLESFTELETIYEKELKLLLRNSSPKSKFLKDLMIAKELIGQLEDYKRWGFYAGELSFEEVNTMLNAFTEFGESVDAKGNELINDKRVDLRDFQITLKNYLKESDAALEWERAQIFYEEMTGK